jgi:hypothetical protein
MLPRRRLATFGFCVFILASPAYAVSLLNGSVLSMNGLNLTVLNCTLILAGWQQASCAAGDLALQAVGGSRGSVGYGLAGDGTGANGTDIFAAAGGGFFNGGLYQVSFTLGVATNQPGSTVSAATLSVTGADTYGCNLFCGSSITASQTISAAAGGGTLAADLRTAPMVSAVVARTSAFTINEIVTVNSYGPTVYGGDWDPETVRLSAVRQTFATIVEPRTIMLVLGGIVALMVARRWKRRHG